MRNCVQILFTTCAVLCCFNMCLGSAVTTEGRKILLGKEQFFVRGVCYQPAPIGDDPSTQAPYGDYFTADYAAIQDRDLEQMRAMGVNVVRIYGWDPKADHTEFLHKLYNRGEHPIRVLINRWVDPETNWSNTAAVESMVQEYLEIAEGVKGHPAVLGFLIGNETNAHYGNGAKPSFWQAINQVASNLKEHSPERLVSVAITDALDQVERFNATMTGIDAWSMQVYRGLTFGDFYNQYSAVSSKPLLVTEFGVDAFNAKASMPYEDNGQFVADAVGAMVERMWERRDVCSGGCVFEFGDEWWKSEGSPSSQDPGGFLNSGYPDGVLNEEWWGIFEVIDKGEEIDLIRPRELFYTLQSIWSLSESVEVEVEINEDEAVYSIGNRGAADLAYSLEVSEDLEDWKQREQGVDIVSLNGDAVLEARKELGREAPQLARVRVERRND